MTDTSEQIEEPVILPAPVPAADHVANAYGAAHGSADSATADDTVVPRPAASSRYRRAGAGRHSRSGQTS